MGMILTAYNNGNGNGMPYASMKIEGSRCEFYPNGNCNGIHTWSMKKTGSSCEVYKLPGQNGFPFNYFKYISPGRFGGRYGGVQFYPNGNGNGIPVYFFCFRGSSAVEFYPNGNGNGMPIFYFEKRGRMVTFYPNGNGNGMPTCSIDGASDVRDAIELGFYLFIPQGRELCPR